MSRGLGDVYKRQVTSKEREMGVGAENCHNCHNCHTFGVGEGGSIDG